MELRLEAGRLDRFEETCDIGLAALFISVEKRLLVMGEEGKLAEGSLTIEKTRSEPIRMRVSSPFPSSALHSEIPAKGTSRRGRPSIPAENALDPLLNCANGSDMSGDRFLAFLSVTVP